MRGREEAVSSPLTLELNVRLGQPLRLERLGQSNVHPLEVPDGARKQSERMHRGSPSAGWMVEMSSGSFAHRELADSSRPDRV